MNLRKLPCRCWLRRDTVEVAEEAGVPSVMGDTETDMPSGFYTFLRQLTPEFVTTRYPDAAYGTPYELYDEDIVNEILKNSKEVLKWIGSQI